MKDVKDERETTVTCTMMPDWMLCGMTSGSGMAAPALIVEALATNDPEKLHQAASVMAGNENRKEGSHAD